jgi:hypothetical protein
VNLGGGAVIAPTNLLDEAPEFGIEGHCDHSDLAARSSK